MARDTPGDGGKQVSGTICPYGASSDFISGKKKKYKKITLPSVLYDI
jgi:hypothetical protein